MNTTKKNTDDLSVAINLCNEGKYEASLSFFDKVLSIDKNNDEVYRMKGQALMMLGRYQEATDSAIDALGINPQNVWTLILMGNILAKQNDIQGAIRYYEEAIKYHPDDAIAINNVGAVYIQQGMYDKAMGTLNRALSIDPTLPNTYYGKALLYVKQGKDWEAWETLQNANSLISSRKENPSIIGEMNKLKISVAQRLASGGDGYRAIGKDIEELRVLGHTDIKIESVNEIPVSAKLEYAKIYNREYHKIIYNENKPYHEHLVLHELTHLRMMINASLLGKNEVPITDQEQSNTFHQRFSYFFNNLILRIDENEAYTFEKNLRTGLALQLFNCPLDLLVEDYIFKNHTNLRPLQMLSLFSQEKANIHSIQSANQSKVLPPPIVKTSKIMNMVTSMHMEELYGIDFLNYYKYTKGELECAKDLYEEYKSYRDDFKPGEEYDLCRYFIEKLEFGDLIVWVNEDVANLDHSMISKAIDKASNLDSEEIAERNREFSEKHRDGEDSSETVMMAMYMLEAMQRFDKMQNLEVRKVAMEIATIGLTGINPNDKNGYHVPSFNDEVFGGYRLLAYYYVSFARELPELLPKIQLHFSKAYEMALQLYEEGK